MKKLSIDAAIDELGGLTTAIRRALAMADCDPDGRAQLVVMPEAKSLVSQVFRGEDTRTPFASLERHLRRLIEEGPSPMADGVLSMPFIPVLR